MDKLTEKRLNEILDAVFFHSAEEYAIGGQRFPVAGLNDFLYAWCYSREFRVPLDLSGGSADPADTLILELTAANGTRERWDYGWKVAQFLQDGCLYAQKGAQSRMLRQGEFMLLDPAAPAAAGAWIRAFLSKDDTRSQPGFYIVHPELAPSFEDFQTLVRLYWDIDAAGAPLLLRLLTERFNKMRVPFQFKTLRYRSQYGRADSAVLFTGWRYSGITLRLAREIYAEVKDHMQPAVPLFAKRLAPGLGLAEDPANGQSFGMMRCQLLCQAMVNAYQKRQQSRKARLSELRLLFEEAGINLDEPHLSISSVDHYVS